MTETHQADDAPDCMGSGRRRGRGQWQAVRSGLSLRRLGRLPVEFRDQAKGWPRLAFAA